MRSFIHVTRAAQVPAWRAVPAAWVRAAASNKTANKNEPPRVRSNESMPSNRDSLREEVSLPIKSQTVPGASYTWQEAMQGRSPLVKHIRSLLPATAPSNEELRKMAEWKPVIRPDADKRFRVAIVGSINTGKSTLFNALAMKSIGTYGRKAQLHADIEGLTRDAVETVAELEDMIFTVIDTPGVHRGAIVEEAKRSLESADLVVMVVAATANAVSDDEYALSQMIRERGLPAVLVINKMDLAPDTEHDKILYSYLTLGLGRGVLMSARSRVTGFDDLGATLRPFFNRAIENRIRADWALEDLAADGDEDALEEIRARNNSDAHIRIAVIGRPNAGKSALINRLMGFNRSRVSKKPNTTRDAVEVSGTYRGRKVRIIDTAGMVRAGARQSEDLLNDMYNATRRAMNFAHVVIVCFDATEGQPGNYDISLCHAAVDEGRPFVLCATKWDAVLDHMGTAEAVDYRLKRQMNEVRYAQAVVTSAEEGTNLTLLMDQVLSVYDTWNRRLRTTDLNRFYRKYEKSVVIPHHVSRIMRITQCGIRPPTFKLQLQTRSEYHLLPHMWDSMLRNALAEEFDLNGVPIRFVQQVKERHPDMV